MQARPRERGGGGHDDPLFECQHTLGIAYNQLASLEYLPEKIGEKIYTDFGDFSSLDEVPGKLRPEIERARRAAIEAAVSIGT